jgi:hypothetical protein
MKKMNIANIQEILWSEIHNLKDGNTTPANVQAITNASGKILSSVALQMRYAQMTGEKLDLPLLLEKEGE